MKSFRILAILTIFGASTACSLSSRDGDPSLFVDLSALEDRSGQYSLLESDGRLSLGAPPASLTGFKCYAVNVTGPGISDSSRNPDSDPALAFQKTLTVPDYTCAYRGIVSPPMIAGAGATELAMKIPPGGIRLVQVIGVNSQYLCDTGIQDDEPGTTEGSDIYELGRAVLRDVFQDQSVAIRAEWPSGNTTADQLARLAKKMDCGDGNCGYHANLFPAAGSTPLLSLDSTKKLAQRLDVPDGIYLRRIDVELDVTIAGSFELAICQTPDGDGPGVGCETSSLFKSSRSLTTGNSQVVSFELRHASLGYLQTAAGSDYYMVLRGSSVGVAGRMAKVTTAGRSHVWGGASWNAQTSSLYRARVVGCGP